MGHGCHGGGGGWCRLPAGKTADAAIPAVGLLDPLSLQAGPGWWVMGGDQDWVGRWPSGWVGRAVGNGRYWTDRSRTEMDDTGGENDQTITHNKTIHAGWLSSSNGPEYYRSLTHISGGRGGIGRVMLFILMSSFSLNNIYDISEYCPVRSETRPELLLGSQGGALITGYRRGSRARWALNCQAASTTAGQGNRNVTPCW